MGSARSSFFRFFSLGMWGKLPAQLQKGISRTYANIYNKKWSRHLIKPYCKFNYQDPDYLEKFQPASGEPTYQSFQDFFIRTYKEPPRIEARKAWPCEGLLCEYGKVEDLPEVKVKGQPIHLREVFGSTGKEIPNDHYFANIFLHNNNYHRIHSPINGRITKIEHIEGELVILRPWIYPRKPSLPALRNERVNVDLVAENGEKWYLSIVGGPAVGTIKMTEGIKEGKTVEIGQELSLFLLGSTCCIAMPHRAENTDLRDQVEMGDPI